MSAQDLEQIMKAMVHHGPVMELPDGSGCFTASMPLPADHWLFKPVDYAEDFVEPIPFLPREVYQAKLVEAARWAIRGVTARGDDMDFDPDALVQNFVYALCGPVGGLQLVDDHTRAPDRMQFTGPQVRRLYDNSPAAQRDSTSFSAFSRIVDLVESAHSLLPTQVRKPK